MLDATGARALGEIVSELQGRGMIVLVKGVHPRHVRILEAVGVLDKLEKDGPLFATMREAIDCARRHVRALNPVPIRGGGRDALELGGGLVSGSPAP